MVTPAADEGRSRVASGLGPNAGDVADETRIIGEGIAARRSGDAARALALFDEHARRYPGGVLGDERDVERVLALCDLGRRDVARAAAARFERTRLGSPLVARIHASCAGPSIR
ncbi:MAG: hypothetical protein FWD17_04300 [Polyangiaceae bacterium]|nr:hypothetical protein [Polyangiaceae bacterium]